jgi:hypothetical protein
MPDRTDTDAYNLPVYIDADRARAGLVERVEAAAERRGMSRSRWICEAMEEQLQREEGEE